MKIGFVIPARLKSTRLPKKILLKLGDQSALEWSIDRASESMSIDEVVVATTGLNSDSEISKICSKKGIRYFMGSPDDVLKRIRDTAEYFAFDYVINITPDNTLFSIYLIDLMVKAIKENPSGEFFRYKDAMLGTGIYAIKREALDIVCEFKDVLDTEIWGPLIHEDYYEIVDVAIPKFLDREYRLTMDTEDDYVLISKIYQDLKITTDNIIDLNVVVEYLDQNPEIAQMNKDVQQSQLDSTVKDNIKALYSKEYNRFHKIKNRVYGRK